MRPVFHCSHNNQSLWRMTLTHLIPLFTRHCTAKASLHQFPFFLTSPHNNQSLWTVKNDFHTRSLCLQFRQWTAKASPHKSLSFIHKYQAKLILQNTHTQLTCSTQSPSTSLFIRNHNKFILASFYFLIINTCHNHNLNFTNLYSICGHY